ncbi:MAG: Mut7-C RNAse domain-containing protein [Noviherbaspirillum sp.]
MVTATFRFHDELNDFLPARRRFQPLEVSCARAASTKHMVEALGVPHTEVGMVLVNGANAGMARPVAQGDLVDVFPGATEPSGPALFVADAHLGGLARLLCMAGFDTLYDNNFNDAEIAAISASQGRIVLTRDRDLLIRKEILYGCYVRALKAEEQLRQVLLRYRLALQARPFSLCLHCNVALCTVDRSEVEGGLPAQVRALHHEFSRCECCGRVYWKGSHWRRMDALLRRLLAPD